MAGNAQIQEMIYELDEIIRNLRDIAEGVRTDFEGVGNVQCANALEEVAERYRKVRGKLASANVEQGNSGGGFR